MILSVLSTMPAVNGRKIGQEAKVLKELTEPMPSEIIELLTTIVRLTAERGSGEHKVYERSSSLRHLHRYPEAPLSSCDRQLNSLTAVLTVVSR